MLPDFRVRQRDFLLEISRAMTAQLDLSEVLRLVLNASVVMLAGQVGLIALREQDGQYYTRATLGMDNQLVPDLNRQLRELDAQAADDTAHDVLNARMRKMAQSIDQRLRQSITLPLMMAGESIGLLIIFRAYRGGATENDVQVLQSFADQAAIAVHNARLYESIDQERRRLAAILEHSADGVMILNADLTIARFNHALERMTGWHDQAAVGLPQDDVIVWKRVEKGNLHQAIANGWPFRSGADAPLETLYVEGDVLRRDGITLSIGITYAPLLTDDRTLANIIANVRDITNFRQAQEMQNTFISGVSHELKTPVALIKGYAQTLRREDATWDASVLQNSLAIIEDEADRLTALISDLLAASKLQAERLKLDISPVALDQLAAQAAERFRTQTQMHHIKVHFPPDFPVIPGDEARLRQVLDNLLSNAIKYSPKGGSITVSGHADEESVTVQVQDEGVGMSETEQERVFERFYRVDSALSRKTQGTGLGLYLAKAIIDAHQGRISVESKPGKGSTLSFTIPQR